MGQDQTDNSNTAPCPSHRPKLRIGCALLPKKVARYLTPKITRIAAAKGVEFCLIDPAKPLLQQGHFNAIIHKLRPNKSWERNLQEYLHAYPEVHLIDDVQGIRNLQNRSTMLAALNGNGILVERDSLEGSPQVHIQAPVQVELPEGTELSDAVASLNRAGLHPPLLVKPLWTDGREGSHGLAILHDIGSLAALLDGAVSKDLKPPLVVQQFVEHGGVLFKVYVVGRETVVASRPSLNGEHMSLAAQRGVHSLPRISCCQSPPPSLTPWPLPHELPDATNTDTASPAGVETHTRSTYSPTKAAHPVIHSATSPATAGPGDGGSDSSAADSSSPSEPYLESESPSQAPPAPSDNTDLLREGRPSLSSHAQPIIDSPHPMQHERNELMLLASTTGTVNPKEHPSEPSQPPHSTHPISNHPHVSPEPSELPIPPTSTPSTQNVLMPRPQDAERPQQPNDAGFFSVSHLENSPSGDTGQGDRDTQGSPQAKGSGLVGGDVNYSKQTPPEWVARKLAGALRQRLGVQLFNFDMICPDGQEGGPSLYYVVDINYFPGVDKIPGFEELFVDFLIGVCTGTEQQPAQYPKARVLKSRHQPVSE